MATRCHLSNEMMNVIKELFGDKLFKVEFHMQLEYILPQASILSEV